MKSRFKKQEKIEIRARIPAWLKVEIEKIMSELNIGSWSKLIEHSLLIYQEEYFKEEKENERN